MSRIIGVMLMPIPKRLSQLLLLLLLAGCAGAPKVTPVLDGPLVISTWPFGKDANDKAIAALASGRSLVDAVEFGIRETERVVVADRRVERRRQLRKH